jgi:hypothetical protein
MEDEFNARLLMCDLPTPYRDNKDGPKWQDVDTFRRPLNWIHPTNHGGLLKNGVPPLEGQTVTGTLRA